MHTEHWLRVVHLAIYLARHQGVCQGAAAKAVGLDQKRAKEGPPFSAAAFGGRARKVTEWLKVG